MRISSNEFYTGGEYLKNNQTWGLEDASWKAHYIYKLLKKNKITVSDIVDVGCGSGGILEELAKRELGNAKFTGYDIAGDAIEIATKRRTGKVSFINGDFTRPEYQKADLVLAIDVIEHIDDFYGFLRTLREKGRYFVFHIPLDLSCRALLKPHILLQQRNTVGHIHFFSKEMVLWFLSDLGYTIVDFTYTLPDIDVKRPNTFKNFIKKYLRKLSYTINGELSNKLFGGYSMMILLKK